MNVKDLGNRAVLTRGAGSGIGRDTALLCARLVICDLNEAGLKEARALGSDVFTQTVDHAMSVRAASTGSGRGAR